jgi:acetyl-CoA carboxylase biotin carboxylase subunit
MFKKVLVANRGEIAVRVVRACRDLGIRTVAVYEPADQGALHVRLAEECVVLRSELGYRDGAAILQIAKETGADAIQPGYGFLAERPDFIRTCEEAGVAFVGPPSQVIADVTNKIAALERVRQAGFAVPRHSPTSYGADDLPALRAEAERLGYPLVVKSCSGGRGRGERIVHTPRGLKEAVRWSQAQAQLVYGERQVYIEKAILPTRQVAVQLLGDRFGNRVHLGERDGSLVLGNQKVVEESPSPGLNPAQRQEVRCLALEIAQLFNLQGACSVEFLVDERGTFYFTEIKARIQIEHPVTEMLTGVDIVQAQLALAAGEKLGLSQQEVRLEGWAMQCRINAEDPLNHFLPSPGIVRQISLPGGPHVRADTYLFDGAEVSARYDPIVAKLVAWGEDRPACLRRLRRALEDFSLYGVASNVPFVQRILNDPDFGGGHYSTDFLRRELRPLPEDEGYYRDLAVAAAIAYARRKEAFQPMLPERVRAGWHRASRRLPGE